VPVKLGEYKNKDDLVKRIKKIDSYVESIILLQNSGQPGS